MNEAKVCEWRSNEAVYPVAVPEFFRRLVERVFVCAPASRPEIMKRLQAGTDLSLVTARLVLWLLTAPDGARNFAPPEGLTIIDKIAALYERRLQGEAVASEEWMLAAKQAEAIGESLPHEAGAAYEAMIMAQAAADHPCELAWMAAAAWASALAEAIEPELAKTPEDIAKADRAYKDGFARIAARIAELL